jgi:hypothetical protein
MRSVSSPCQRRQQKNFSYLTEFDIQLCDNQNEKDLEKESNTINEKVIF